MKAFGRVIEFEIGGSVICYPDFYITFSIQFNTDSDGNTGNITLYNLSEASIARMGKGVNFILKAGYKGDVGIILPGVISESKSIWNTIDKVTRLVVNDNSDEWVKTKINRTWKVNSKASEIAKDIIRLLPQRVGEISPANDIKYPKGKTFSCTCKEALEEIAEDTGSKLHISRNVIYLHKPDQSNKRIILLNKDTGLVGSPERVESESDKKMYEVSSLLNYRIESDSLIRLQSKDIDGIYRVVSGNHDGRNFYTNVEVEKYAG
jgi:hypothetical protein